LFCGAAEACVAGGVARLAGLGYRSGFRAQRMERT
jgi:hypothetical protein